MASKKDVLSDKLKKSNDSFTVNIYDNGYMVEVEGRDHDDDWATAKVLCSTIDELVDLIRTVSEMERS